MTTANDLSELSLTGGGGPILRYRDPSTDDFVSLQFDTIQAAIDYADANGLVGVDVEANESEAIVEIPGGAIYSEAVAYPDTGSAFGIRGIGANSATHIKASGAHGVHMRGNDATLRSVWVDQTDSSGSYHGIYAEKAEARIVDCSVDLAPHTGIFVNTNEAIVRGCEVQGGQDQGLFLSTADRCNVSDIQIKGVPGHGVNISGDDSTLTGLTIRNTGGAGLRVASVGNGNNSIYGATVIDSNSHGALLRGAGSEVNCTVRASSGDALRFNNGATGYFVTGRFEGSITIESSNEVENIVQGWIGGTVTDNGVRTLINGRGTNAGDPSTTGQWNGNAAFAEEQNALIRDTTNGAWYRAVGGSWVTA